jgi:uncharacterized protein
MTRPMGGAMIAALRCVAAIALAPLLILTLAGCSDAPGEVADGPPPNPLLYEIAGADGAVEGWMLGTIHALPAGTRWRTPAIASVVEEADLLVVEIAALDDRAALAATFDRLSTSPGLPPLNQRIAPDLAPALADLIDEGGLDPAGFRNVETWAAALTLAQIGADGDSANGVDRALISEFDSRQVRELEGAVAQLAIFDRLPETEQRDLLAAVVRETQRADADPGRLRRIWLSGDLAALEAANRTGLLADPQLRDALLTARNRAWVAAVLPMLDGKAKPLIAVGTAHLVGPEGLASQLQARGYRIRRLP